MSELSRLIDTKSNVMWSLRWSVELESETLI